MKTQQMNPVNFTPGEVEDAFQSGAIEIKDYLLIRCLISIDNTLKSGFWGSNTTPGPVENISIILNELKNSISDRV